MTIKELLQKHTITISISIFLLLILTIIIGLIVQPGIFYDQWIWKYYWGPIVSDGAGHSVTFNGVVANEGYTLVSEITYGIILIIALYVIYKLLKKLQIVIDWRFCLALMPYILFGPVTRVLEDANYFSIPAVYWFISPLIYLQIAAYALFFIIIWYYLEKIVGTNRTSFFISTIVLLLCVNVFETLIWIFGTNYSLHPAEPVLLFFVSCSCFLPLIFFYIKQKSLSVNTLLFSGGLLFLLPSLYLTARWIAGAQWSSSQGVRFDVFLLIVALVGSIAIAVYLLSYKYRKHKILSVYKNPLNLSLLIGHMIDGITSYVSIYDPLKMGLPSYLEKHPASNTLMEIWPPLFPIVSEKATDLLFS